MFTKENTYRAYFYTPERDQIEVLVKDNENPKKLIPVSVDVDPEDRMFERLLSIFTLDQIEEMTKLESEARQEALTQFHVDLIESGRAAAKLASEEDAEINYEEIVNMFIKYDPEKMEEEFFKMKISVFEIPEISHSKDTKFKENIRLAKTPFELVTLLKTFKPFRDEV
jgi:hypothetical protein